MKHNTKWRWILVGLAAVLAMLALWQGVLRPAFIYHQAEQAVAAGNGAAGCRLFEQLGKFGNAAERAKALRAAVQKQRGTRQFAGMEWLVLEQRGGKELLLLRDVLELRPWHSELESISWQNSGLRSYLNTTFLASLPEPARSQIQTEAQLPGRNTAGNRKDDATADAVFLLSSDEAQYYFAKPAARVAYYRGQAVAWWLRSAGAQAFLAGVVQSNGALAEQGSGVNDPGRGLRPAIWIKAEK